MESVKPKIHNVINALIWVFFLYLCYDFRLKFSWLWFLAVVNLVQYYMFYYPSKQPDNLDFPYARHIISSVIFFLCNLELLFAMKAGIVQKFGIVQILEFYISNISLIFAISISMIAYYKNKSIWRAFPAIGSVFIYFLYLYKEFDFSDLGIYFILTNFIFAISITLSMDDDYNDEYKENLAIKAILALIARYLILFISPQPQGAWNIFGYFLFCFMVAYSIQNLTFRYIDKKTLKIKFEGLIGLISIFLTFYACGKQNFNMNWVWVVILLLGFAYTVFFAKIYKEREYYGNKLKIFLLHLLHIASGLSLLYINDYSMSKNTLILLTIVVLISICLEMFMDRKKKKKI